MTDDPHEHFKKFLQKRGAKLVCEVCGHTEFGMPNERGLIVGLPVSTGVGLNVGTSVPAYVAYCLNCGNMRLHARAVVDPGFNKKTEQ
jgi:predicted nucleic-acid-binding Zn-ribbon protein